MTVTDRINAVRGKRTHIERWSLNDTLDRTSERRAMAAVQLIKRDAKVVELGCGNSPIEAYLPASVQYQPSDLVARDERTLIADLNQPELPTELVQALADADSVLMLGVLEYLFDLPQLIEHLVQADVELIFSYADPDTSGLRGFSSRAALGWVSDYSIDQLYDLFDQHGMQIVSDFRCDNQQRLYIAKPKKATQSVYRLGLISQANAGDFGDRLGQHLVNAILPANIELTRLNFQPWIEGSETLDFDCLIVGNGNSLMANMLTPQLAALIERTPKVIGLFGMQYRDDCDTEAVKLLIRSLDIWYGRYLDDVELYAVPETDCRHLGDWIIHEFTPSRPTVFDKKISLGREVLRDQSSDRLIHHIQTFSSVTATRASVLLCAMTSADLVSYTEERDGQGKQVSGKCISLLRDLFGRSYPENTPLRVDRQAVMAYRQGVIDNLANVKASLAELLGIEASIQKSVESKAGGSAGDGEC